MKKLFFFFITAVILLSFLGCTQKIPAANEAGISTTTQNQSIEKTETVPPAESDPVPESPDITDSAFENIDPEQNAPVSGNTVPEQDEPAPENTAPEQSDPAENIDPEQDDPAESPQQSPESTKAPAANAPSTKDPSTESTPPSSASPAPEQTPSDPAAPTSPPENNDADEPENEENENEKYVTVTCYNCSVNGKTSITVKKGTHVTVVGNGSFTGEFFIDGKKVNTEFLKNYSFTVNSDVNVRFLSVIQF